MVALCDALEARLVTRNLLGAHRISALYLFRLVSVYGDSANPACVSLSPLFLSSLFVVTIHAPFRSFARPSVCSFVLEAERGLCELRAGWAKDPPADRGAARK